MGLIFLSYRRDASAGYAGRLYDRLVQKYGKRRVFMDVDAIPIGEDFVERIKKSVATTDVMLALISSGWAGEPGASSRLDNPNDFVRLELATALERGVIVIPVILPGATVPVPTALPDALAKLAFVNAFFLPANGFHQAVDGLIKSLDGILTGVAQSRRELAKAERKRLREQRRLAVGNSAPASFTGRILQRLSWLFAGSNRRGVLILTAGAAIAIVLYIAMPLAHDVRLMNAKLSAPTPDPITYAELPHVVAGALEAADGASFAHYTTAYVLRPIWGQEDCDRESNLSLDLARVLLGTPTSSWLEKVRAGAAAAYLGSSLKREDAIARYAQLAFFGQLHGRSITGIRQAAQSFYSEDLRELNLPEAASLAGILAEPLQKNFYRHPDRGLEARNCVLWRMVERGYISADEAEMAAKTPLDVGRVVSAREAFDEASTGIHGWRADAILVGLSQRGVINETAGDVKRDEFVDADGNSDIWVAEFYSPSARTLKTIQISNGRDLPPDPETRYADLPERFTDLAAIGDEWMDSTSAVRLAREEAYRNKAPTKDVVFTAALTRVGTAPPEWAIRFRERSTDDIFYIVRIEATSQRILLAKAL
jgi:hypothetical protein